MVKTVHSASAVVLAVICLCIGFSIKDWLLIVVCLTFSLIGALICFLRFGMREHSRLLAELDRLAEDHRFSQGLPSFIRDKLRFKNFSIYAEKHSMTGFDNIDSIIEQILHYVIRDYIDSWYKKISPDTLFQESLKRTTRRTITAFSHCVKKVDWTPLLTRHFVDDFASHLRLYRKAKEKLQCQKENLLKPEDLESVFFDLELEMERSYCRDLVATSSLYESAYLHDIVDIFLYLLMPSEDFRSRPLRFLIREIIVTKIIVPVLDKFSDPLYVNYLIVWLLSGVPIGTDDFVTSLETCQCVQELESVLESVHEEINSLRSKDNGICADSFKQQLTSLEYTERLIKRRMVLLANQPDVVIMKQLEMGEEACCNDLKFVNLPITVVLTHQTAVSYFIDFLTQVGGQNFIDFYLSVEGFKVSVEHQLRGLASGETIDSEVHETVKEAALFMYRQYLSQEAITRVPLDDAIINKFLARLRNDEPFDSWFEQLQENVVDILTRDERFYPAFKKHPLYLRMLEELGILRDEELDDEEEEIGVDVALNSETSTTSDTISAKIFDNTSEPRQFLDTALSLDSISEFDVSFGPSSNYCRSTTSSQTPDVQFSINETSPSRRLSTASISGLLLPDEIDDVGEFDRKSVSSTSSQKSPLTGRRKVKRASIILEESIMTQASKAVTTVVVETLGVGQQGKQMFALYNVRVSKTDENGRSASSWNVIRRYSDFHTLNAVIIRKFPNLRNMSFPGKKTFNNLDQSFLDKRCKALNSYMTCLLQPSLLENNLALKEEVFNFLSQKQYGSSNTDLKISKKVVSAMFDPILSGVRAFGTAVTAVPDQVFDGIGKVSLEINKAANQVLKSNSNAESMAGNLNAFNYYNGLSSAGKNSRLLANSSLDSDRVAAHLKENELSNESIPLRVLLLFVDEVFGLRGRNQWFRRRLVSLLRQFINAALGSSINRRILDAVQWLTSNEQVAQYLAAFRDSTWGETTIKELNPTSEALRTRFLARCLMLSALPDELRLFIGASTTINGVNNISEALQNRHLNRRFWYVIFERLLSTIFPNNRFDKVLPILHSKSPRTRMS